MQRGADEAAIKAAYRRLAKECHPDRHNGCPDQEARFKAVNEAYDVLKDPQKRAAYDRFGKAAFQNGGNGDPFGEAGFTGFSDIFSTIFGEFMDPRGARQNAARGADLRYDLELSSGRGVRGRREDHHHRGAAHVRAVRGPRLHQVRPIARAPAQTCGGMGKVRAQQGFFVVERGCPTCRGSGEVITDPCANCHGEGRALTQRKLSVKVPAGVDEGTRIRVSGEGEAGVRGAPGGDLYLFVHMKRHPIYAREGTTLGRRLPG